MAINYDKLNLTELVTLVRRVEPNAHRGLPREVLVGILEEEIEPKLPHRIIDGKRLRIMEYINGNWTAVRELITCPAKSRDPHACFGCSDLQVSLCTIENSKKFLDE